MIVRFNSCKFVLFDSMQIGGIKLAFNDQWRYFYFLLSFFVNTFNLKLIKPFYITEITCLWTKNNE